MATQQAIAGDEQQTHQRVRRDAERIALPGRGRAVVARRLRGRRAEHQERQRQDRRDADDADRHLRRTPALGGDEVLHQRRPDDAGEIVAAGCDARPRCRGGARTSARCRSSAARTSRSCRARSGLRQRELPEIGGHADSTKPAPSSTAPATIGTMTPKRSASRPITMPPAPKPIMVSVNGSDASPRATPKSACTAGSATTKDHMPTPPMVPIASATQSLIQACLESTSLAGADPA